MEMCDLGITETDQQRGHFYCHCTTYEYIWVQILEEVLISQLGLSIPENSVEKPII